MGGTGVVTSRAMEKIYKHLKIGILVIIMVQFSQSAYASGIRISWQANSEKDVAGYKVYYGTASGDYDNVIDVGNVTTVDIGDLENANFFFAITAYNTAGEESGYSEEMQVSIGPNGTGEVLPGGGASGESSGGGGGGGGGCFLSTSPAFNPHLREIVFLAVIWCVYTISRRKKIKVH